MNTKSGKSLSKIGIGSWGVGGFGHRSMPLTDKREDSVYLDALVYTLEKGINFTEISLGYGHGNALLLFKQALDKSSLQREDFFLTHAFYPSDLPTMETVLKDADSFFDIMKTDYADSTLVTQSMIVKFGEKDVFSFLHNLLDSGKTRYVSLSNANPTWITKYKEEFGDTFFAHEGHLSFEVRVVQDKGVFDTCDELSVQNIIWRPLRKNLTSTHDWPLLVELSEKYGKTQNQIVLNWMCHLGYKPMVMSQNKKHIDENVASTEFEMSGDDYNRITNFRPTNYNPPEVDWDHTGGGDSIVVLANDFEKHNGADKE